MNNKEKLLKDINENLNNYGKQNRSFTDEIETAMYLLKEKTHYLSNCAYANKNTYDVVPNNNFNEISTQYETLWGEIIEDIADTYYKISELHQAMKVLDKEQFDCLWGNKNKGETI